MIGSRQKAIDYDQLASEYARHRQVHPAVLQELVQSSQVNSTSQVLEVGCGTGNYLIALQRVVGCACWGIDPSGQMLEKARQRAPHILFQKGSAEALKFPDDAFDLVFSVDVIHHVGDRQAFFHQAQRVLRPGGLLCTVTDSEQIIRSRQPLSVYFPATIEPELQRYPPISDLM